MQTIKFIPTGEALRGPTSATVRTSCSMMATSTTTVYNGIPAGIYFNPRKSTFHSPFMGISNNAWQVYLDGDVHSGGSVGGGVDYSSGQRPAFALRTVVISAVCAMCTMMAGSAAVVRTTFPTGGTFYTKRNGYFALRRPTTTTMHSM